MAFDWLTIGDLQRYIATTATYKNVEFGAFSSMKYSGFFLASVLFWVVENTTGHATLPFYAAFIVYSLTSYVLLDFSKREKLSKVESVLVLLGTLFVLPPFAVVSALRSSIALSVGVLALYRSFYRNKRDVFSGLLYLTPCFIHAIGYMPLLILLLTLIFRKFPLAAIVISVGFIPLALTISVAVAPIAELLNVNLVNVLVTYTSWTDTGYAAQVAASRLQRFVRFFSIASATVVLSVFLITVFRLRKSNRYPPLFDYAAMIGLGMMVGFALSITVPSFMRLSYAFQPLAVMYLIKQVHLQNEVRASDHRIHVTYEAVASMLCFLIYVLLFVVYHYQYAINIDLVSLFYGILFGSLYL